MNTKTQYNWTELGGVDRKQTMYGEGAEFTHPSGVVYVRVNGNWVIKKETEK